MDQVLHVFRKDIRRHWREIVLSIAILTAFAWSEPINGCRSALPKPFCACSFTDG